MIKYCGHCGNILLSTAENNAICNICGEITRKHAILETCMWFCNNCNAVNPCIQQYCLYCGRSNKHTDNEGEMINIERNEERLRLITKRVSDPLKEVPEFPEIYYCSKCDEYFVMKWQKVPDALPENCYIIYTEDIPASVHLEQRTVFCPKCNSNYPMYGTIHGFKEGIQNKEPLKVFDRFVFPFPPGVSSSEGLIKKGDILFDSIVIIVTGNSLERIDIRKIAYYIAHESLKGFPGDIQVHMNGGIQVHLYRTNLLSDETEWMTDFLIKYVYNPEMFLNRMFFTKGPFPFEPLLSKVLICLTRPPIN